MSWVAVLVGLLLFQPASLRAMEGRIAEIRAIGATVQAAVELGDVFAPQFRELIEEGRVLHLRVEAEFWEDRRLWDRLIAPTVFTFLVRKAPSAPTVTVEDPYGGEVSYEGFPDPITLHVDVGPTDRIDENRRYYLRALILVRMLAEEEIDSLGEALFGRDGESGGLAEVGKSLFRKTLQISDYFNRAPLTLRSDKISGTEILGTSEGQ